MGLGLFLGEIGHAKSGCGGKERRPVQPVLTRAGLLGISLQVIVGWFDPDEEHVPLDMFTGAGRASARKSLIQQYKVGYFLDLRQ